MIEQAESFFEKHDLFHPEKTYLVGFSGGFDSSCMLDILHKISKKYGFKIIALHLNHNWRAEESDNEEFRCKEFCETRNIPIITKKLGKNTPKTETGAREARLEFFGEKYQAFNADGLFLAHTKSDNAETVVYRLIRGTGMRGLCGIFEHNCINGMKIYRPLLNFTRKEIENYCKAENLSPNCDSSNENTKYKRNFIRKNIIPLFKELNPDAESALAALSVTAQSEQNIISEYLEKIRADIVKSGKIDAKKYFSLSKDVKKRILLDLLVDLGLDYDSRRVFEIYDFLEENSSSKSGKTCSLARDLWLFVSQKEIYTFSKSEKCEDEVKITGEGQYFLNGYEFFVEKFKMPEAARHSETDSGLQGLCEKNLPVRFRNEFKMAGESCHPELGSGSQGLCEENPPVRFRNEFGMTGESCHPELGSGSQGLCEENLPVRFQNEFKMAGESCHPELVSGSQGLCAPDLDEKSTKNIKITTGNFCFPGENSDFIYCSNLDFPLTLRYRNDGDRIRPFGMEGTMKLKKLFINKNIPKNERESVILLCKNNEILWAHGICVSEKLRVKDFPEYVLKIRKGGDDG